MNKAASYSVIETQNASRSNRKRIIASITAQNFQNLNPTQLAQTAMKAAWELGEKYKANAVTVRLVPLATLDSDFLARADFASDGRGWSGQETWQWHVQTASCPLPPLEYFQTAELWYSMRKNYQMSDPYFPGNRITDEDALRKAISQKLKISINKIHLPNVYLINYLER